MIDLDAADRREQARESRIETRADFRYRVLEIRNRVLGQFPPAEDEAFESGEIWEGAYDAPWALDDVAQAVVAEIGPMTLAEVGECLGVSRERVRQVEESALRKLAATLEADGAAAEAIDLLRAWAAERGDSYV